MRTEVTFLGVVRKVVGSKLLVEISSDIPSASPIIHGRIHRIGQIGSFVRVPLGFMNLYGIVSIVGATEIANLSEDAPFTHSQRWIEVQLVGESYYNEEFQRGVSVFPTIDDEVHLITEQDLAVIYQNSGDSMVQIGFHATSDNLPATVNLDKLVTRHAAILGSTGSGKSNTVATFLKALTEGPYPNAHVVIIDPHGEYGTALQERARVFSISNIENPLIVPYWALSFDELASFLVDRRSATESVQDIALRDYMFEQKRKQCAYLRAGFVDGAELTVDSPVPFCLRKLWYDFDRKERITYEDMPRTTEALITEGSPDTLTPAKFRPPGAGMNPPFKPNTFVVPMASYINKILGRLKDKRYDFLLSPGDYNGIIRDIHDLLSSWIDHEQPITVLDLGGVPYEVMDLVVGVVTRIIFEGMFWGRDLPGIGKQRPLLMVYEEAHSYLPKGGNAQFVSGYAGRAVRRIFKEGRKYGVGAIVVSQRPSELDDTILSQCGTFFSLRLSNGSDQGIIKATVPDSLAGLTELLPALRTGEALVMGEAVQIPSRIRLPKIEPRPKSDDPEVTKCWMDKRNGDSDYAKAITGWRTQCMAIPEQGGD